MSDGAKRMKKTCGRPHTITCRYREYGATCGDPEYCVYQITPPSKGEAIVKDFENAKKQHPPCKECDFYHLRHSVSNNIGECCISSGTTNVREANRPMCLEGLCRHIRKER